MNCEEIKVVQRLKCKIWAGESQIKVSISPCGIFGLAHLFGKWSGFARIDKRERKMAIAQIGLELTLALTSSPAVLGWQ